MKLHGRPISCPKRCRRSRRAGEAGRASRSWHRRSAVWRSSSQAAKDIKELITSSSGQVKDGVDLVSKAGAALTEIVESIKKVTADVTNIANVSLEQSTGIEQIKQALTQMDDVTQQNSALVEQNAATAKTLEGQAKAMDERVAFFRLRSGAAAQAQFASSPDAGPSQDASNTAAGHSTPQPQRRAAQTAAGRSSAQEGHGVQAQRRQPRTRRPHANGPRHRGERRSRLEGVLAGDEFHRVEW
jgi:hypothetical protein